MSPAARVEGRYVIAAENYRSRVPFFADHSLRISKSDSTEVFQLGTGQEQDQFLANRVRRTTVQESVAAALREAIYLGLIRAGTRLNQDELAERYGVSRIPVREALRQLHSEGLIEILPHRGAAVSGLSPKELRELYEIRIALETLAVQFAVPRVESQDLATLGTLLATMDEETDPGRWLDRNQEFHAALYAPAQRPRLQSLIETLRRNTERYLRIYVRSLARMRMAQEEHRRIVESYSTHDVDGAVAALRIHLENTLEGLEGLLRGGMDEEHTARGLRIRRTRA